MGFGILLFGYFITTMVPIPLSILLPIDITGFIRMLGYILVIIAAKKLSEYNSSFGMLVISSIIMAIISAIEGIVDFALFFVNNQIVNLPFAGFLKSLNDLQIVDYLNLTVIVFVSALCLSIKQIGEDTGIKKVVTTSVRNLVFFAILFVVKAISFLPIPFVDTYANVFVSALLIIELVCWMLNLYMIFYCYAKICDSSDIDMKQKESRFDFVNRRRAEREEERNKIIDEFENKNKNKNKKKKKK